MGEKVVASTVRAIEPRYRKSIKANQVELLKLLYNVRYASTDIVAELVKKDRSTIYESLFVLEKQGYVHKLYDKTYRLRQRPATYCLAAKGIKHLRDNTKLNRTTLRNYYKNRSMREEFVDRHLLVATLATAMKRHTGDTFSFYTKYQLNKEAFVNPLPDLFIKRKGKSQKPDYILDVFEPGTFTWLLRRRINQHKEQAEENEYVYPNVLFVAQNASTEKRLFKLTYENYEDFNFYITQEELLLNTENGKAWINMEEAEEDEIQRVNIV